jgi:hypothetical protein
MHGASGDGRHPAGACLNDTRRRTRRRGAAKVASGECRQQGSERRAQAEQEGSRQARAQPRGALGGDVDLVEHVAHAAEDAGPPVDRSRCRRGRPPGGRAAAGPRGSRQSRRGRGDRRCRQRGGRRRSGPTRRQRCRRPDDALRTAPRRQPRPTPHGPKLLSKALRKVASVKLYAKRAGRRMPRAGRTGARSALAAASRPYTCTSPALNCSVEPVPPPAARSLPRRLS